MKKDTEKTRIKSEEKKAAVTEMVFILDKSGSMAHLASDTVGGFNSMIGKQKKEEGDAFVTTVFFDTAFRTIHDRVPLSEVKPLTDRDYVPGGCTALLDALGQTIEHIRDVHRYIRPEDVPEKTIFVITTDGLENASRRFTAGDVKNLIEARKEEGWEFLFLAANIDAVQTAHTYGIGAEYAASYTCDEVGTAINFEAVSEALCSVRSAGCVPKCWKKKIDADHASRKKK